jgi:hypothetical protein
VPQLLSSVNGYLQHFIVMWQTRYSSETNRERGDTPINIIRDIQIQKIHKYFFPL